MQSRVFIASSGIVHAKATGRLVKETEGWARFAFSVAPQQVVNFDIQEQAFKLEKLTNVGTLLTFLRRPDPRIFCSSILAPGGYGLRDQFTWQTAK